jgi:hypothetical protein
VTFAATQSIFSHVLLRPCVSDETGLTLLTWQVNEPGNCAVQVYVNEHLYEVVERPGACELWMQLDRTQDVRVELLAVDPGRSWTPSVDALQSWSPRLRSRVSLAIPRPNELPVDARAVLTVNGVNEPSVPLWSDAESRSGFGGLMGIGGFGYDDATSIGFGLGLFGRSPLGTDDPDLRLTRDELPPGEHTASAFILDHAGNRVADAAAVTIETSALPRPASSLTIDPTMTLHWQ